MRATNLGLKHPREINQAPYYNPQVTAHGDTMTRVGKDYKRTRVKSFSSSRFYHPLLVNKSTTDMSGPGRYVSELGTVADNLKKHTTFRYKEEIVSSLNPEAYTMVGDSKIFFPEAYSPRMKRSLTPTAGLAKSIDYSAGYAASTSRHLNNVMGTIVKSISGESQIGNDSTRVSRSHSSNNVSVRGSKGASSRAKNVLVTLDSPGLSTIALNSSLSGGQAHSNIESAGVSRDVTPRQRSSQPHSASHSRNSSESKKKTTKVDSQNLSTIYSLPNTSGVKNNSQISIGLSQPSNIIERGLIGQLSDNNSSNKKQMKELGRIVSASPEKKENYPENLQLRQANTMQPKGSAKNPCTKHMLSDVPIMTRDQMKKEITSANKNPFASFQNKEKAAARANSASKKNPAFRPAGKRL